MIHIAICEDDPIYLHELEKTIKETKGLSAEIHPCSSPEERSKLYGKNFENDYHDCLRYVIWNENNLKRPKLLDMNDYENIINSDCIFARKVSSKNSSSFELVKKIYKCVGEEKR